MVDTIAQLIIGLKNANNAGKASTSFPYSKMTEAVLEALHKAGYVGSISKKGKKVFKSIEVDLVYVDGKPRIEGVQQISKYSRRMYVKADEANSVRNGFGALVLTTPKGILVDRDARKEKVGGEALFKIW
jgi:small subunit ribosomal protein S8